MCVSAHVQILHLTLCIRLTVEDISQWECNGMLHILGHYFSYYLSYLRTPEVEDLGAWSALLAEQATEWSTAHDRQYQSCTLE